MEKTTHGKTLKITDLDILIGFINKKGKYGKYTIYTRIENIKCMVATKIKTMNQAMNILLNHIGLR